MTARESRPVGTRAAEDLAGGASIASIVPPSDSVARVSGPQVGAGVLVVKVEPHTDGREIELATTGAVPGRHVRLVVGGVHPPLWVRNRLRADLRVQVEATDDRVLCAWLDALGGTR